VCILPFYVFIVASIAFPDSRDRLDALWQTRQGERRVAVQRAQRETLAHLRRIARDRKAVEVISLPTLFYLIAS
jgi:hypothetical protein